MLNPKLSDSIIIINKSHLLQKNIDPQIKKLNHVLISIKKKSNLEQYLKKFELTLIVMQTPESLIRYSYELIEDVNKENVIYIFSLL